MASEIRPLLLRANRLLGANLVEHNLVAIDQLEQANEKLLELVTAGNPRQSSLLSVLAYDMKILREEDVLAKVVEEFGLGLVDLGCYDCDEQMMGNLDVDACWATWTIPFDHEENTFRLATAYYLSPAVRTYWEKKLGGQILWYGSTMEVIAEHLDRVGSPSADKG